PTGPTTWALAYHRSRSERLRGLRGAQVRLVGLRERMAALAARDEEEVPRRRGRHRRLERPRARVGDRPRGEPLVRVRRVWVVRVVLDGGRGLARELGARRGLLGGHDAPIRGRRIALEAAGGKRRIAKAVQEDAGDDRALVVGHGL